MKAKLPEAFKADALSLFACLKEDLAQIYSLADVDQAL